MIDRLKIDAMYSNELTHADLSDRIEYATCKQVLILSSTKRTTSGRKKGISYRKESAMLLS